MYLCMYRDREVIVYLCIYRDRGSYRVYLFMYRDREVITYVYIEIGEVIECTYLCIEIGKL